MSPTKAYLALLMAAAFWGFGNIAQKSVLFHVGPLTAVGVRCAVAALVMLPLLLLERDQARKPGYHSSAMLVSACFGIALMVQQTAYLSTSVTNASFLVNTCAILTPMLAWFLFREHPGLVVALTAALALFGIFLMTGGLDAMTAMNRGDVACLVSAVFYALWIVLLGRHAQTHGFPFTTALIQFLIAALCASTAALAFETVTLQGMTSATLEFAVLGIFSTAAAFGLQTYAQRYTSASYAAVVVSAESIFGALGAYVFLGERPAMVVGIGALLILTAIVWLGWHGGKADQGQTAARAVAP
jgi:drug/metabolite transporter (DMT)-like permease